MPRVVMAKLDSGDGAIALKEHQRPTSTARRKIDQAGRSKRLAHLVHSGKQTDENHAHRLTTSTARPAEHSVMRIGSTTGEAIGMTIGPFRNASLSPSAIGSWMPIQSHLVTLSTSRPPVRNTHHPHIHKRHSFPQWMARGRRMHARRARTGLARHGTALRGMAEGRLLSQLLVRGQSGQARSGQACPPLHDPIPTPIFPIRCPSFSCLVPAFSPSPWPASSLARERFGCAERSSFIPASSGTCCIPLLQSLPSALLCSDAHLQARGSHRAQPRWTSAHAEDSNLTRQS
ncbi:hypothetical protein LY78DRAFT_266649 [Colletotrichum sublineola]|nr:hypothetical protein LY78DRAFT_266649 [Colletotrichum sublineola]